MKIYPKNIYVLQKIFAHTRTITYPRDALLIGKRGLYVLTMLNQSGTEKKEK